MCDMTFAEAAEVLSRDDVSPRAKEDAIEVALRALEQVEIQAQVIVNQSRDMKAMRKAMNGQSEYAYLGGDLISREALIERMENVNWYGTNDKGVLHSGATGQESAYVRYADVAEVMAGALAVEAEPVVHAHWVRLTPDQRVSSFSDRNHRCSNCNKHGYKWYDRCWACGAVMDEKVIEPTPLIRLDLGGRINKRLRQMGVRTVEELEAMDKHTLHNIPGLGRRSIETIESELRIWKRMKENNDG